MSRVITKKQNEHCAVKRWFKIAPQVPNIKIGSLFSLSEQNGKYSEAYS